MDEWAPIPLSHLTQAGYCLRRAALLINEQLWQESADTAKGRQEHERVHTERVERRGDQVLLYEYQVHSKQMNIGGKCDCVEAIRDAYGCRIPAAEFPVRLYPVEYKHGKLRTEEEYELQLCAQAMCLEEMYSAEIPEGAIFYISAHRRKSVLFTQELRSNLVETVRQLEEVRRNFTIPAAASGPKCVRCSLKNLCMPDAARSAKAYCRKLQQEAVKEDAP